MKLYPFDADLDFVPMAARRVLDLLRVKLSLATWQTLPRASRERLADGADEPDLLALRALLPTPVEPLPPDDPEAAWLAAAERAPEAPPEITRLRAIPGDTWRALARVDRYALAKYARRGRAERFLTACEHILPRP